jgi:mannose/cellobiose epimerase-like protein (N-acyl-D-glucosamine 2-epimerase family)
MPMPSQMQEPFINKPCEHCGIGQYIETHETGDWWAECNECQSLLFCYKPMPHQALFHMDNHKFKMFSGGYG